MESQGLTLFALVFMLASMGAVTLLMIYCFWRILRQPPSGSFADGGRPAGGGSGSGTAGGGPGTPGGSGAGEAT